MNTHKHLNRKILGISQEYRWNFLNISQTLILAKAVGVTESLHLGRQPALKIVATIFNIVPPPHPFPLTLYSPPLCTFFIEGVL